MTKGLLSSDWAAKLSHYNALYVGFSGGLDSTVLLHALALLPTLRNKLHAVHINHGLSANATAWQAHCQQFCEQHDLPFIIRTIEFNRTSNIEENARDGRYNEFYTLLTAADGLLLAHHADDQAETLLLQLLRGAGVDGLAAMVAEKKLPKGSVLRPFLHLSRQELEDYARVHELSWIEDESNQDSVYSRNYLRHQVMPLLQARWPAAAANLVRTASHCQQAKSNLDELALIDCVDLATKSNTLLITEILFLNHGRLSNVLRVWLKNNGVRLPPTTIINRLITEVMMAAIDASPCVEWDDVIVKRYQDSLYLLKNDHLSESSDTQWSDFPAPLKIGVGTLQVTAVKEKGLYVPPASHIQVCFRRGGEAFYWRGHTRSLKKLFQEWKIPPWQREQVPLIYINDCLAAVVGFAISDDFYRDNNSSGLLYSIEFCSSA